MYGTSFWLQPFWMAPVSCFSHYVWWQSLAWTILHGASLWLQPFCIVPQSLASAVLYGTIVSGLSCYVWHQSLAWAVLYGTIASGFNHSVWYHSFWLEPLYMAPHISPANISMINSTLIWAECWDISGLANKLDLGL